MTLFIPNDFIIHKKGREVSGKIKINNLKVAK